MPPTFTLPEGFYISLSGVIRPGTGGQTRALVMRNRLFTQHAGIATHLVSFDDEPVYPATRAELVERGELVEGMTLHNIFEHYREQPIEPVDPASDPVLLTDFGPGQDVKHPDGTVYLTRYRSQPANEEYARDYRRPDGSVFLRAPAGPQAAKRPQTPYLLIAPDGRLVGSWDDRGDWWRHWLQELAGDAERVVIISDSRFTLARITPFGDPRFHVLHLMHNAHTLGERRWNSALSEQYGPLLDNISKIDGLVTLTDRQRDDVAERYGRTENLFVVPNPVVLPELPDPMPERDSATFAVVSRLEAQKRLDHAVEAFALVLKQRPEATLLIYGHGSLQAQLQRRIDDLGVGERVRLCGHDPRAREQLLTATGMLMTSTHEGYPLATLESMAYGCPVLSYDIKYGPRDQVTDGVDGFVVPVSQQALADKIIALIDDPALVRRLSAAALAKAEQHDYRAFLDDWRSVIETAIAQKPRRVTLTSAELTVERFGWMPFGLRPRARLLRRTAAGFGRPPGLKLLATLRLQGSWPKHAMADATLRLTAVAERSDRVTELPLRVRRNAAEFTLSSAFRLDEVFGPDDARDRVRQLRLQLVVRNAAWQTVIGRPTSDAPAWELDFDRSGQALLVRGPTPDGRPAVRPPGPGAGWRGAPTGSRGSGP